MSGWSKRLKSTKPSVPQLVWFRYHAGEIAEQWTELRGHRNLDRKLRFANGVGIDLLDFGSQYKKKQLLQLKGATLVIRDEAALEKMVNS